MDNISDAPPTLIDIGRWVVTKKNFSEVPAGTKGLVDAHYDNGNGDKGIIVAWDLPGRPVPLGYTEHDPLDPIKCMLRDGFDPYKAARYLVEIDTPDRYQGSIFITEQRTIGSPIEAVD